MPLYFHLLYCSPTAGLLGARWLFVLLLFFSWVIWNLKSFPKTAEH